MTRLPLRCLVVASALIGTVPPAFAGGLRGRFLLGDRPAPGVTVSAVPYEAPLDEARREARRLPPPPPLASVTTTSDGSYALGVPAEPGQEKLFTVRAEGGGAVAASIAGVWDATESADLGDHVLLHGTSLVGRVTDAAGAPVANAEVVLLPQLDPTEDPELGVAPRRATTGADGSFRFDDASATGNTLTVDKPGMLVAQQTGVKAGTLRSPVVLTVGSTVSGLVRKGDGTSPAAGTLVRVEGRVVTRWVEAGADGSFVIPNAPAGAVTVVADAGEAGYVELGEVKLPLAQGTALTLLLRPASALVGRTLDARTGRPVPRTTVEVRSGARSRVVRSGPDGTYALRALPPRSWQLRADEPHYVSWTHANVPVRPGETRTLDIPLLLGASLSGRVTDENGQPVGNARGLLTQTGLSTPQRLMRRMRAAEIPLFRTRPDGSFKATRLAPGESQVLSVSHPDFERATLGGLSLLPGATRGGVAVVLRRGSVLTGVVQDGDGQPIAAADVELSPPFSFRGGRGRVQALVAAAGGASAERKRDSTGVDGRFSLRGVAPGEHALTVSRSGYATQSVDPVKVPATGSPIPLVVTLTPGAVIAGRVVRGGGTGAEGFLVSAVPSGRPRFAGGTSTEQPTGPDGAFSIEGLQPGQSYDLRLLGSPGAGEEKRGVVAPVADIVLTAPGLGRITGTALDAHDGHPLTDFQVSYEPDRRAGAFPNAARSGARGSGGGTAGGPGQPVSVQRDDGAFTLEEVPAGTWSVVVSARGYQLARTAGVVVEEGATHDQVEVRATRGVVVKGHAVDAQTGAAVANATVSLTPAGSPPGMGALMTQATGGDLTTDADGRFVVEGAATGTQSLHVTHPDYRDAIQNVEVTDDGATVEVPMTQGGVLAGSVTSDTGQPVAGANVDLSQAGGGAFGPGVGGGDQASLTDAAGQFRFDHLGAGRYTVSASLGSHTSAPVEVVLQADQAQENVALQLEIGVTLQGTVSGLPDTMISGTAVSASGADSYFQSTRTGTDGRFDFDNVPIGVVTLRGTATEPTGSTRSATTQVTTSADQPVATAELVFDQGFTLSGRVTQAGQPVSGAVVSANLLGGGGRQASSTTDDDGAYQLAGLQQGTYTVNAMSVVSGTAASQRQTITLTSDQILDIVLPSATIAGQVVDADGNLPLADARVSVAAQDPGSGGGIGQRPATTDSNGRFSFANLNDGTYTVSTSKADYQVDTRDVTATDAGSEGLVVTLSRGAGIAIRVQDGLVGVPLGGAMVRVFDGQGGSVFGPSPIALDGDGRGEIPSLPPGTYTVVAAASGYSPLRLDGVTVPSPTIPILLTPGGTVVVQAGPKTLATGTATGTVATAAGQPALLSLFNLEGRIAISEPNLQLRNVPPGSYLLSLPEVAVTQPFVVTEGAQTLLRLP